MPAKPPPPAPPPPPAAPAFVGRERELAVLRELRASGRAELFVLYGRRRVGKTELLQQLCADRPAIYFLAAQVRDKDNLRAYRDALAAALDDPLAASVEFPDWTSALDFTAERARGERLVVVLDEFPYLCEANKGMASLVQRFWDTRGKKSSLMLVLCGSQVSFMEREVLGESSPLYGRRTGQRRLEPLSPIEALRFFPRWDLQDRVLAYSILGGMPAYLQRFDDGISLAENVAREVLRPEGYLFDEVQFLLRSELTSPTTYNSILAAVARGADKVGDIALEVGVDTTTANKYLTVLRELRFVEREVPLTDLNPLRSRRGVYRIADRFLAFHFRHVQPNVSLIHAGRGARVFEERVLPDFPRLYEEARDDFILDHLLRSAAELVGDEVVEAGRHRGGRRVRALARTAGGATIAALVVPEDASAPQSARAELASIDGPFARPDHALLYRFSRHAEEPLVVEAVPRDRLG